MKLKMMIFFVFLFIIISGTVVYAEELYTFTDSFNKTDTTLHTGTAIALDESWESKKTGSMDGNGEGVTTFGFNGQSLVVNTFKQDTYPKISSAQLAKMPGINFVADHYKLSDHFEINMEVTKTHNVNMWGVKFLQHNNEKNYYLLFFGGRYSYQMTNGLISWGLYKVIDGNVTILHEQLQSDDANRKFIGTAEAQLTLTYNEGKIDFSVDYDGEEGYYSGSYTDENPYCVYGNNSGVQLVASSCGNSAYPIYFNEFNLKDKKGMLKDELYRFSDGFDTSSETMSGTGIVLNRNWASKTTGTMNGDGTGTTTFGLNDGSLVVNTFRQDTYPKISSSQLAKMPGFNWTTEHVALDGNMRVNLSVAKSHNVNMWGIKFMQHNNEKNYYLLFFGGQYSYQMTSGLTSWGLYKITDGNVTILKEQLQSENPDKKFIGTATEAQLSLTYNNGEISFRVKYNGDDEYYSGTYIDSAPYVLEGNESGVQLVASSCGNNAYPIYFKDVSIESYKPYITDGEPEDMIYVEVTGAVDKNVISLADSRSISKLVYTGIEEKGIVYASNDGKKYEKLADLADFKNGVWTNTTTSRKFRYVMFDDAENLQMFEDVKQRTIPVNSQPFCVYVRENGIDDAKAVLESSDSFVVITDGNKVIPMGIGQAVVSSGNAKVLLNIVNDRTQYTSDNALVDADNMLYTGNGVSFGAWRSKSAAEGNMGKNNDAMFGTVNNKLRIYGSSNSDGYDYNIQYGLNDNSVYYPALICDAEIQGDSTVDITFKKSHPTQTMGIKLLAGQNQSSSYTLWFPGLNSYGSTWMLYRELDGMATCVAQGDAIVENVSGATGYIADGESHLTIDIVDNKIAFVLDYNGQYTISGEYTDNNGLSKSGSVWLMAGAKASNSTTDKRYVEFYDISLSQYNDRKAEKDKVMYYDAAVGKKVSGDIIDLGEGVYISRIDVENPTDGFTVSVSADNERYYNIAKESGYNPYFTDKYRYVKVTGVADSVKVLSDCSMNQVKSYIGNTIALYPYLNGTEYAADSWECTSVAVSCNGGKLTSDKRVSTAVVTAKCGDVDIYATVGFDYPDYSVYVNDGIYTFSMPGFAGRSVLAVIAWYGADGTMKKIGSYDISVDENGVAQINTGEVYGVGVYSKIFIMQSSNDTLPLTNVKIIY